MHKGEAMKASAYVLIVLLAATLTLSACGGSTSSPAEMPEKPAAAPGQSTPAPASETLLGKFIPDGEGGFTHRWLAYIIRPQEGAADQNVYVELNGQRLGPYSNLGRRFALSPDGEHIAIAVEKDGKWWVILDGEEKWALEGFGWAWYAWTADLEGKIFVPQTKAPVMTFSEDGKQLAYMVGTESSGWAIHVNGKPGPAFQTIYVDLKFVGDQATYQAQSAEGEVFVFGERTFGPYDTLYRTQYSSTGEHFAFYAEKGGCSQLVVDGDEKSPSGKITGLQLGPSGEIAYSVKTDGQTSVALNGQTLPGTYDEVTQLTLSPDGKHLAFWARSGSTWSLVTDTNKLPGFDGYYYFEVGGEIYAILWDRSATSLAYFAKDGDRTILALNGKEKAMPDWPGLATNVYVDDRGNMVGTSLMGGPNIDREAYVECLLQSDNSGCDPLTVTLARGELAYVEKGEGKAYMVIGEKREGPYKEIVSGLLVPEDRRHYAYLVRTEQGYGAVLDGKLMERVYDAVYRPSFVGTGGFAHLGRKGDQVFSAYYPWPQ